MKLLNKIYAVFFTIFTIYTIKYSINEFQFEIMSIIDFCLSIPLLISVLAYSFNIKVLNRVFWRGYFVFKITMLLFSILIKKNNEIKIWIDFMKINFLIGVIWMILFSLIPIYILYRYVYEEEIWNNKKIENDKNIINKNKKIVILSIFLTIFAIIPLLNVSLAYLVKKSIKIENWEKQYYNFIKNENYNDALKCINNRIFELDENINISENKVYDIFDAYEKKAIIYKQTNNNDKLLEIYEEAEKKILNHSVAKNTGRIDYLFFIRVEKIKILIKLNKKDDGEEILNLILHNYNDKMILDYDLKKDLIYFKLEYRYNEDIVDKIEKILKI